MQAQSLAPRLDQSTASAGQAAAPILAPGADHGEDELRLIGATRAFGRDAAIFCEGDPADCVYKVMSGAVRAFRLLADGRRQITDFHLRGDMFGVELGAARRGCAESLGETVLLVARRGALSDDHAAPLWRLALRDLERSRDHVLTLGRRSASERVASLLIELAERLGGERAFELPMSRQDMADHLGLTIETVSRVVTQLQADGLIALSGCRRLRLVRPAALAELCE